MALPRPTASRAWTTPRPLNPDFVLNQPRYQGAQILLARENFGCGSARARAVGADDYGFRAVIAPSFADIFFNNCFKNGMLPIRVRRADGRSHAFEVDAFHKHCQLGGLDEIGLTLQDAELIRAFEARRRIERPWLFGA
jgi:3-isopropylmalate/(R)-2-methylmalate dehydratase small subunit